MTNVRLWKQEISDLDEIKELDKKYKNFTSLHIDGKLIDGKDETVDDLGIGLDDILIAELPKEGEWVLKPTQNGNAEVKMVESVALNGNINDLFLGKSRKGQVALHNLGNTCFMSSGLQCLTNTMGLTSYFLLGHYKKEINKENPLGMKGKFAEAYAGLMREMWCGSSSRVAPTDLKRTLGSRISRFSGYGQ